MSLDLVGLGSFQQGLELEAKPQNPLQLRSNFTDVMERRPASSMRGAEHE